MQRIDFGKLGSCPHFIGAWKIESQVCDKLVSHFETNKNKQKPGVVSGGLNLSAKNSLDISIRPNDLNLPENSVFNEYFDSLNKCYQDYLSQWPFLSEFGGRLEIGKFNMQRYEVGQHFHKVHAERTSLSTLHRVLVWMTYLNDVDKGGSTSFPHYNLTVKPEKSLTLIWPSEWTHSHNGNSVEVGSKYIITGWMHFPTKS